MDRVLQVVPLPALGSGNGVSDYASILGEKLRDQSDFESVIVAGYPSASAPFDHVILHYVNYGYQRRGVPFRLIRDVRRLRRRCSGKILTVFHETYASGTPRQSAFWLRPFQKQIVKALAGLSDFCFVSNELAFKQVRKLEKDRPIFVHPVPSNFGEPVLTPPELCARDPHRWVVAGGTVTVEKSLHSLLEVRHRIPPEVAPQELLILGGEDNPRIRSRLESAPGLRAIYRPRIERAEASSLLATAAFGWLDYFHRPDVAGSIVSKSSVFAAYSAHGVVCIFPHRLTGISESAAAPPGLEFFVSRDECVIPPPNDRSGRAVAAYRWYREHAASEVLARAVTELLRR